MIQQFSISLLILLLSPLSLHGGDPIRIWPDNAPGETTRKTGTQQPFRPNENPPVVRITGITDPTMTFHPAPKPNGVSVLILPGGGFGKVVTNKEGSELAAILNQKGVSAFVLSYRTKSKSDTNGWSKPLQDAQRAMSYIRANAKKWKLDSNRIGLVGFSAGGNVAARLLCDRDIKNYKSVDDFDNESHRPNFAMLIYPWNIFNPETGKLVDDLKVPKTCPPTFLVHTSDDRSTSLGSIRFYYELKQLAVPAAIHIYATGGHGYGTRQVKGSNVGQWPKLAERWISELKPEND